jgi:U4/U6.U5 tri-snRNP-associated protein 3
MGRSRSRSRERKRDRERDREGGRGERETRHGRDRDRERSGKHSSGSTSKREASRSRSRSPHRSSKRRSPSPPSRGGDYLTLGNVKPKQLLNGSGGSRGAVNDKQPIVFEPAQLEGKSAEEIEMMKIMGFGGFDTTKNKKVEDGSANAYAVNIQHKRKYRQYMNRKGGFNKPLDPVA